MTPKAKIVIIYFVNLIGIIAWLGGIFLTPYLKSQYSPLSSFLYAIFSPTCHQIPSRCFNVFGYPLAVCARCLGIYAGFSIGTLIFPALRGFSTLNMPKAKTFILFSLPIVMSTAGNFMQIWSKRDGWPAIGKVGQVQIKAGYGFGGCPDGQR